MCLDILGLDESWAYDVEDLFDDIDPLQLLEHPQKQPPEQLKDTHEQPPIKQDYVPPTKHEHVPLPLDPAPPSTGASKASVGELNAAARELLALTEQLTAQGRHSEAAEMARMVSTLAGKAQHRNTANHPTPAQSVGCPSNVAPTGCNGQLSAQPGTDGYMRSKAHEARGVEQKYLCGYCANVRTSASACGDGRVRIRCNCGGKHKDGTLRMHANWSPLVTMAAPMANGAHHKHLQGSGLS
eukprot:TRINITY_DN8967_c0_g1_i2.p1 TRINITY_DN8967_c0_g1~~TRINITY_DN8967_c0_g1_i2.p1  ORF type:complete len:241 (-),score=22.22 TRINITY_DN8967_c0_g1_i2:45-767(-)